jgi:cation diffusion facilitator CzcD-associated flavoprotein CzcO
MGTRICSRGNMVRHALTVYLIVRNVNTYPGCACDIPGIFYSFSFDPHPGSTFFLPQKEIRSYLHRVSDKYGITPHIKFNTVFTAAKWSEESNDWMLTLKDSLTGKSYLETVEILILAIGGLAEPNKCKTPGAEDFRGTIFHSARWRHDVSLKDKNVIVLGNGCSASQLIPAILHETKCITQFIRTPQWYLKTSNRVYSKRTNFLLKWVPGALWLYRFVRILVNSAHKSLSMLFLNRHLSS